MGNLVVQEVGTVNGTRHPAGGRAKAAPHAGRLATIVRRLERDVLAGLDRAADVLLSPLVVDFRGWTFGDQRNETWM